MSELVKLDRLTKYFDLGRGQRVHRGLRRLRTGRRIADVLPPQLRQLWIVRHIGTCW